MRRFTFALPLVVTACARPVPQDAHTGRDGRADGASAMPLVGGTARATGVVSYPGGDRVDWKRLDVGEGPPGTLTLTLRWTAPRPGLRLGLRVFDDAGREVAVAQRGRLRQRAVLAASGTYLIEVYARTRADAGAYTLTAAFTPGPPPPLPVDVEIPPPPELPAVPPYTPATVIANPPPCTTWDPLNPRCPPCPTPPDPRIRACAAQFPPCTTCNPPRPITARIVDARVDGTGTMLTLDRGADDGARTGAEVRLERGRQPICKLARVNAHVAICHTTVLDLDPRARLTIEPP